MHENEIVVLALGSIVGFFIVFYRHSVGRLPAVGCLFAAYFSLWVAWLATNIEHIVFPGFFNLLEHLGYAANGLFLLAWCWFALGGSGANKALPHD